MGILDSNPSRENSRFSKKSKKISRAHTASCLVGNGVFSGGLKRPERETDLLPPSEAMVKDEWRWIFNLPISLPSMDGEHFRLFAFLTIYYSPELSRSLLRSGVHTKKIHTFLFYSTHVTCHTCLILLGLITRMISVDQ